MLLSMRALPIRTTILFFHSSSPFAREHPELKFLITRIGCGIAGFEEDVISPLFAKAHGIGNILLPAGW